MASAILSEEPQISIAKLTALWTVFLFYLTRAVLNRRSTLVLVALLILSGCAGTLASVFDLVRGRGVVVETIGFNSPFHRVGIQPGDTIWRVNGRRVYSVGDLDEALKAVPANTPVAVGIISRGEQVERAGLVVTQPSASGIVGTERNHRFRASGWTRHYQTFAEIMQMIALLALGLALAHLRNHGPNKVFRSRDCCGVVVDAGIGFDSDAHGDRRVCDRRESDRVEIAARCLQGGLHVRAVLCDRFWRGGRVANARSEFARARRSEFIATLADSSRWPFAHSDSSDLWAWHGRNEVALERVGLSRERHTSLAFDSTATGLRSRTADAAALALDDDRCSG